MITQLETFILNTAQSLYDSFGWLGVAGLLAFENATGITASEIILGLAGWLLISEHGLSPSLILLGGLYAAVGSTLGVSIPDWMARLGGRPAVESLAALFRIDAAHIVRAEHQFHHWGIGLVLLGRILLGIRTLINISAGLARMPFIPFLVATFIGAYIWCTLLIGAGYVLGHEWELISAHLKKYSPYLLGACPAIFAFYVWWVRRPVVSHIAQLKPMIDRVNSLFST